MAEILPIRRKTLPVNKSVYMMRNQLVNCTKHYGPNILLHVELSLFINLCLLMCGFLSHFHKSGQLKLCNLSSGMLSIKCLF